MDHDNRRSSLPAWCAALILFLPVVCMLSIGPVVLAANHFESLEPAFDYYVAPAEFVYELSPQPVKMSLEWYVELWDR